MTVPFYSQDELNAAIAKERQWIAAHLRDSAEIHRVEGADGPGIATVALFRASSEIAGGAYLRPMMIAPRAGVAVAHELQPEQRDGMPIGYFIADPFEANLHHPCSPKGWWYVDSFLKNDQECIADAREHAAIVRGAQINRGEP